MNFPLLGKTAPNGGWAVYKLHPEGHSDSSFYVGMTLRPRARMSAHRSRSRTAAQIKLRELERQGVTCEMTLIKEFPTKHDARALELSLIRSAEQKERKRTAALRRQERAAQQEKAEYERLKAKYEGLAEIERRKAGR